MTNAQAQEYAVVALNSLIKSGYNVRRGSGRKSEQDIGRYIVIRYN